MKVQRFPLLIRVCHSALHKYNKDSSASSEQIDQLQKTISKLETEKLELAEQHASMTAEVRQLKNELERKVHMALNSEKSYHRIQATLEKQTVEVGRMQNEIENKQMEILGLNGANSNLVKDTKALRKELIKVKSDAQDLGHHLQELKDHVNRQSAVQTNTKEANKIKNELLACKKELNELRSQQSHRNLGM
jgi:chromosome segregation ATPase